MTNNIKLNPWYITGFTDGEGTFSFSLNKKNKRLDGTFRYHIQIEYKIAVGYNPYNLEQFKNIQNYFGVGKIYITEAKGNNQRTLHFRVFSLKDCLIIRKHFEEFPLLTDKNIHFNLWCKVLDLIINKEHTTEEGLNKIVALKEYSPKGVSSNLQINFPSYKNYLEIKPDYNPNWNNLNIHWLCGFINADGHFKVQVLKSNRGLLGKQALPVIVITQHSKNISVLNKIQEFLGLGYVFIRKSQPAADFKITNLADINLFIIKFKEAQLLGAKALDYSDFCLIINLLNNKPLTKEILSKIEKINSNVNNNRKF
jgi:hypothetical protein